MLAVLLYRSQEDFGTALGALAGAYASVHAAVLWLAPAQLASLLARGGPDELVPVIVQMSDSKPWDIDEEQCRKFVAIFDKDGDDQIGLEDLRHVSEMLGRPLGDAEVAEIVRRYEHKKLSEDSLNFAEFYRWLRDEDNRRDA